MSLYRFLTYKELAGDLFITVSPDNEIRNIFFSLREFRFAESWFGFF
jgi:hypothetical protein